MFNNTFKKIFLIIIFSSIFVFFLFQFKPLFKKHEIIIQDFEKKDFLFTDKKIYNLKGRAEKIKKLLINGKEILLNENYEFNEKLFLFNYENIFYINSLSKTSVETSRKLLIFLEQKEDNKIELWKTFFKE
jgi:hypothetical protein